MIVEKAEDLKITQLHALVYGDSGVGKTYSLRTLASGSQKLFVFCTDPGGMTTLRGSKNVDFVIIKDIVQFETDLEFFEKNLMKDYFAVAFDSLTTISELLMDHVIRLSGRLPATAFAKRPPGTSASKGVLLGPNQQDYGNQMTLIYKFINYIVKLPTHVVCTAHAELTKDELSGRIIGTPMVTGKLKGRIPLVFDEIYLACRQSTNYFFRTQPDAIYVAKSRLSKGGLFSELEEPDFGKLLRKAGVCEAEPAGVSAALPR